MYATGRVTVLEYMTFLVEICDATSQAISQCVDKTMCHIESMHFPAFMTIAAVLSESFV